MDDFTRLVDLASARLGGAVLWANDDFFAPKENLVKPEAPTFDPEAYTDRGKEMDGWESRRRRVPGHDVCILRLGLPGIVRGVVVDTAFFRGNYPEQCSLEGCAAPAGATVEQLADPATEWLEIVPRSPLAGDSRNRFAVDAACRFTHLRFHIYPDGGVARLRVHGEVVPDWPAVLAAGSGPDAGEVDLVAVEHGGRWLGASDLFFSSPQNLLMPGRGRRMDDGWETKRRRGPGNDWCVLRLGVAGSVRRVVVDTAHFKGNYPDTCALEGCVAPAAAGEATASAGVAPAADFDRWPWRELVARTKLDADAVHELVPADTGPVTHLRFSIYPDGGVSRLRALGAPSAAGLAGAAAAAWSAQEQSGVGDADAVARAALAVANRAYRERFGHIFIVCATGKSVGEMLALCQERLNNDPARELAVAAEEQRKITRLRLAKLLSGLAGVPVEAPA